MNKKIKIVSNKKVFFLNIFLMFCSISIDRCLKLYALNNYEIIHNDAFIFGVLKHFPLMIRISFLVSAVGIIFIIYLMLLYLLNEKLFNLKLSLSLLMGGILGNGLDKIIYNKTIDFIHFKMGAINIAYNLADVFQWFSVAIILFYLFKRDHLIWFPEDKRKSFLLYPREQLIFCGKFCAAAFVGYIIIFIFAYSVIAISFSDYLSIYPEFWFQYFISLLLLGLLLFTVIFCIAIKISNQYFGPIYKLEQYLEEGDYNRDFQLRRKDKFKFLEKIVNRLRKDR